MGGRCDLNPVHITTDQLHAMGSSASGGGRSVAAGAGGSVVSATGFAVEEGFDGDEPKEK